MHLPDSRIRATLVGFEGSCKIIDWVVVPMSGKLLKVRQAT